MPRAVQVVGEDDHVLFNDGTNLWESFACARAVDGSVSCWGSNRYGQLGDGKMGAQASRTEPARVSPLPFAVDISTTVHPASACAVDSSGGVWCWGTSGLVDSPTPVAIPELSEARLLAKDGGGGVCVARVNGTVACVERTRAPTFARVMRSVSGLTSAHLLTSRCAVARSQLYCWTGDETDEGFEARPIANVCR